MSQLTLLRLLTIIIALCTSSIGWAQISLYDKMLDPLAIARLGGPDTLLQHHIAFVHGGFELEQDGYRVLADLAGPGIVSHIWVTYSDGRLDTASTIKVSIDDSLVYHGAISDFFVKGVGRIRAPLDTMQSGGLDCDVQIPFKRNFKITYKRDYTFFALTWRKVSDPDLIYSFHPLDTTGTFEQTQAESVFRASSIAPLPATNETRSTPLVIGGASTVAIYVDEGAGIVQKLQFIPEKFDTTLLRQLWLRCYWDGDVHPAIDVPLLDIFGAYCAIPELDALQLKANTVSGFTSLLPMPFSRGARIELVNNGDQAVALTASLSVNREHADDSSLARLSMQFNEVVSPRIFHHIPVAHAKGRGRYIGVMFNIPNRPTEPYYLEGNPKMHVDSNTLHYLTYPGTEDYFNGGWYFIDGPFSLPFAGCPIRWSTVYRFHYLDVTNFNSSFDLEWEHGARNDLAEHYRVVSFLYLEPRDFWVMSDSLVQGAPLQLGASGYEPQSLIEIRCGTAASTITAGPGGDFTAELATGALPFGEHELTVNGVSHLRRIAVLPTPIVEYVIDSQYSEFTIFDSLAVKLRAFRPNERINVSLGSQHLGDINADSLGFAQITCPLRQVAPGEYQLKAVQGATESSAPIPVTITKTLRLEVEHMKVVANDCSYHVSYHGWFYTGFWSNNTILFIYPGQLGHSLTVRFDIPFADTFACTLSATAGIRYANMAVSIDGSYLGTLEGYVDTNTPLPFPKSEGLLPIYLTEGSHDLRFTAESKHPDAIELAMGPDILFLTPQGATSSAPEQRYAELNLSYSLLADHLRLQVPLDLVDSAATVTLVDLLGKTVCQVFSGPARPDMAFPLCGSLDRGAYFAVCKVGGQQLTKLLVK